MKHSIRRQMTAVFIILILGLFALFVVANSFLLENYYIHDKKNNLISNYKILQEQIYDSSDSDMMLKIESLLANSGISAILMDTSGKAIITVSSNDKLLKMQFYEAVLSSADSNNVLEKNEDYTILRIKDKNINSDYLILWGTTEKGEYLMLRTTVNSIKESVNTSNTFMMYIVLIGALIGSICIYLLSRRLTTPILDLAEISAKMTNLDFETKYSSKNNNEIDLLGENMNQLSNKLEQTISELKTANSQLERDLQIKTEAEEMRREFLANVSHELKTPITVIQGYAEGLRECVNNDEASRNAYCDVIIDEAFKMNKFVKQLLNLNQIESGIDNLSLERFNIVELIKGKMSVFSLQVSEKNIEFLYEGPDSAFVCSDSLLIEEVLTNYITNAINFVSDVGQIKIFVDKKIDRLRVSVYNTGSNIPEDELDKIWNKLYKVDKARTRSYGGNGIGLSIVKAAMESLQNDYGVYNVEKGVVFWFEVKND